MFTNDTFQGRNKAKRVPLSDQWDDNIPKVHTPKGWRPDEFHKTNVLNDRNGKGVEKFVIEDVFHSFETGKNRPNPHNFRTENGCKYFDFPSSWVNAQTVNRSVALRSIQMVPKSYFFEMVWKYFENSTELQRTVALRKSSIFPLPLVFLLIIQLREL
jgi:hypothetical protein